MTSPRPRRRLTTLVLGSLVVATGGAGLYASVLSVSSSGTIGAGATAVSASCDDSIAVTLGPAEWDELYGAYMIDDVILSDLSPACDGSVLTMALTADWTDPDLGASGTETILLHSQTVTVDLAGTTPIPFTQSCDNTGDGVVDPDCSEPFPVAVDDFDDMNFLLQDDPATTDDPDAVGDVEP